MAAFTLEPSAPFQLSASAEFLCGFKPASGNALTCDRELKLVFRLDRSFEAVAVRLAQPSADRVEGEVFGTRDVDAARAQVARMLSLDVDARGWAKVGERDPVIGRIQARYPGFFPVCFPSPYEAAVWGVLAQRVPMTQAARLKAALAAQDGEAVALGEEKLQAFPSPTQLLESKGVRGLPEEKLNRLQGVARAALEGTLDAERLRAMSIEEALETLEELRGVGAWTAQHILMRGAALSDALPSAEPRVLRGIAEAYGLSSAPTAEQYAEIAEAWRPYRMWACILLVRSIANTSAWKGPEPRGRVRTPSRTRGRPSMR